MVVRDGKLHEPSRRVFVPSSTATTSPRPVMALLIPTDGPFRSPKDRQMVSFAMLLVQA
jgi:hypothetical protein